MSNQSKAVIIWPPTIKTKRLIVRPLVESDYEIWLKSYLSRKQKQSKYDTGKVDMKECTQSWFKKLCRRHLSLAKSDRIYIFGIFEKSTGHHLGVTDISTIRRSDNQWASLGYFIHNQFWGKGYASEAISATIEFAFRKLHFNRLEAAINIDNRRSIALAKAIGMEREGVRKKFIFENEKWVDHIIYVALPHFYRMKAKKPKIVDIRIQF